MHTHMQIHIYAYKNTQKIRNALLQSIYLHAQQISLSLRLLEILQHNKIVDFFFKKRLSIWFILKGQQGVYIWGYGTYPQYV